MYAIHVHAHVYYPEIPGKNAAAFYSLQIRQYICMYALT